jgi:hypothetical protein
MVAARARLGQAAIMAGLGKCARQKTSLRALVNDLVRVPLASGKKPLGSWTSGRLNRPISAQSQSRGKFAGFANNLRKPVREAVEAFARRAFWQSPAKHLQDMLRSE